MKNLSNHHQRQDKLCYGFIFIVTLLRVLTTKVIACPPDFDCNAYIHMANHLAFDPAILPHHAMRILPSFLAHSLESLGVSLATSFRILSDSTYVLFGCLVFWSLRKNDVKPLIALSFTLLCLAPHHAMRIPLQNVYQLCDIMTYPLSLMLLHFSLKGQNRVVFLVSIIGLVTKQTLFGFGGLALLYCFYKTKRIENVAFIAMLGIGYLILQYYYHAFSIVTHHLIPNEDFYSLTQLGWIITDAKLIDLFIPILPFCVMFFKRLVSFLWRAWHVSFTILVLVCQPLIAYHLTGNNFQRLALQGVWLIYLVIGLVSTNRWHKQFQYGVLSYAACIYFTWGMAQRMVMVSIFSMACIIFYSVNFINKSRNLGAKNPSS